MPTSGDVYQRRYHSDFPIVCLDEALSILSRQCLDRRIADLQTLTNEVSDWVETCNQQQTWIDWRFTTEDAHLKLKRLHPSVNP